MISLLSHFLKWIEEGVIYCVNLFISSVGTAASYVLSLLPNMPSVPTISGAVLSWISYGEYWFPVTYLISLGASMLVLWFTWMVVAIPLRWFKVVRGND